MAPDRPSEEITAASILTHLKIVLAQAHTAHQTRKTGRDADQLNRLCTKLHALQTHLTHAHTHDIALPPRLQADVHKHLQTVASDLRRLLAPSNWPLARAFTALRARRRLDTLMNSLGLCASRVQMHALAKGRPSERQRETSPKRATTRMERARTWHEGRRSLHSTSCTDLRTDEEDEGKKTLGARTRANSMYTKVPRDDSYSMGLCYEKGIGVARNMWRAASYFKQAADAGDVRAKCDLGVCYQTGRGVDRDAARAVDLYQEAADAGYSKAQCNLARCYAYGNGVERDVERAVGLYKQAVAGGNSVAKCNLGVCYQKGVGVPKDLQRAIELYEDAGTSGYARAWYNLGVCYESGTGVETSMMRAIALYKKAARGGFSTAKCTLASCYESGVGVDRDINKAIELYKDAAASGSARAQFALGQCYEAGRGVEGSVQQAMELYKRAADAGLQDAVIYLRRLPKKTM